MQPDFVFIVTYECPRCHAALEDRSSGPPAWLRCPNCGKASLSPEHDRGGGPDRAHREDFLAIAEAAAGVPASPLRPRPMAPLPSSTPSQVLTTRRLLGGGFFLTTMLFLFALLDANGLRATIAGVAALVFLFLLTRPMAPGRRA